MQQALVDRHGSQCGFCTPGFVMQLYAGWLEGALTDRQSVKDWLAGNLCRCTGYGPIIDAGLEVGAARAAGRGRAAREPRSGSTALDDGAMLHLVHGDAAMVFAPRTADELAEIYLRHPDAVLVAGATDVGLWVTKQHRHLKTLIDVTRVAELAVDRGSGGRARRSARRVSHRDATAALARLHPDLGELMRRFASIQIRNAGTVGGNIANGSPIGDLPPALIALDARLTLRRGAERREIPLEDFFIAYGKQDRAPGEFVESVFVPRACSDDMRFACYKLSKRFDQDISAVMGAFRVTLDGGKVARRRASPSAAWRRRRSAPPQAEAALRRQRVRRARPSSAPPPRSPRTFAPITDMRASAGYRLKAAQNLLRRFQLENAAARRPATRVLELA